MPQIDNKIGHYKDFVHEAHQRLFAAKKNKQDHRWEGQSKEEWDRIHKRDLERVKRRDDVLKHLEKKLKAFKETKDAREAKAEEKSGFDKDSTAIVSFDGKPVVEMAAYWLDMSRKNGWGGVLNSGYRSPEYSQQLCYGICGAPSCPGRCAGTSSNHTKTSYPGPAVDVSDYGTFEQVQYKIGSPFRNNLPIDPVHYSQSGS